MNYARLIIKVGGSLHKGENLLGSLFSLVIKEFQVLFVLGNPYDSLYTAFQVTGNLSLVEHRALCEDLLKEQLVH
jgi:hypothetical protein